MAVPAALTLEPPRKNSAEPLDKIDEHVLEQMRNQHIPGLALGIFKGGRVYKAEGYGWADVESQEPVRPTTVFQIQSVTKSFTATALMLLVEAGKLGLTDRITNYVAHCPESWSNITVRHLLTHTSGIKDFINEPTVPLDKDLTPEAVVASLADRPLNFAPGEKYAYSNTGYHLLGMIIRQLTGQAWEDVLRARIFAPLGMKNTDINSATCALPHRAAGYLWDQDQLRPGMYIAPTILGYAGGGMLSTIQDLARWDAALYTDQIVKSNILAQMWTPARFNDGGWSAYGLGWGVKDFRGHRLVAHSGAHATGFRSIFLRFPEDQLTVVVLLNQRGADPEELGLWVARDSIPGLRFRELPGQPEPSSALTQMLKTCLADLAQKKENPLITPAFRAEYAKTPSRAKTLTARLEKMSAFTHLVSEDALTRKLHRFGEPVQRLCCYKMVTGPETRYYLFYLTAEEKLAYYQSYED